MNDKFISFYFYSFVFKSLLKKLIKKFFLLFLELMNQRNLTRLILKESNRLRVVKGCEVAVLDGIKPGRNETCSSSCGQPRRAGTFFLLPNSKIKFYTDYRRSMNKKLQPKWRWKNWSKQHNLKFGDLRLIFQFCNFLSLFFTSTFFSEFYLKFVFEYLILLFLCFFMNLVVTEMLKNFNQTVFLRFENFRFLIRKPFKICETFTFQWPFKEKSVKLTIRRKNLIEKPTQFCHESKFHLDPM